MACLAFCLPTGWDCEGRGVARPVVGTRLGSAGGGGGGDDCAGDGGETACGCGCVCGGGGGGGGALCTSRKSADPGARPRLRDRAEPVAGSRRLRCRYVRDGTNA